MAVVALGSAAGWAVRSVVAAIAAICIYVIGASFLRKLKVSPEAQPDPEQVIPVEARFRCVVCGAEVLMTAAQPGDELEAPRHCREDMVPIG